MEVFHIYIEELTAINYFYLFYANGGRIYPWKISLAQTSKIFDRKGENAAAYADHMRFGDNKND